MSDKPIIVEKNVLDTEPDQPEMETRREFLKNLGRWSAIVIGGAALGGAIAPTESAAWINGGGGAWVNARGGGGGGWANRAGGGGAWANRAGGGGAWVNNRGGGGAWVNRH
jgi:hypothetical protein